MICKSPQKITDEQVMISKSIQKITTHRRAGNDLFDTGKHSLLVSTITTASTNQDTV